MAQRFSACLWPGALSWSPGIKFHVGLPAWSLLLPLPVSLMNKWIKFKKLKTELSSDAVILLLTSYPNNVTAVNEKKHAPQCYSSIIYGSQCMEPAQVSLERWTRKNEKGVVSTLNGILLSHKNDWSLAICTNMDGAREYDGEWDNQRKMSAIWYLHTWN